SSGSNASSWCYGVFRHDPDLAPSAGDSRYGFERGYVDVRREGEGGESERVKILVKGSNRQINGDWVRVKVTETTDKDGTGEGRQERKKEAEEEENVGGIVASETSPELNNGCVPNLSASVVQVTKARSFTHTGIVGH
ncbi:hypothetical protein TrRE_jg7262, partial [Triparma retinervis]